MNNICMPILNKPILPYIGKGLIILYYMDGHYMDISFNYVTGILEILSTRGSTYDSVFLGFSTEADLDNNDNCIIHNVNIVIPQGNTYKRIDIKQYGYSATNIPKEATLKENKKYWICGRGYTAATSSDVKDPNNVISQATSKLKTYKQVYNGIEDYKPFNVYSWTKTTTIEQTPTYTYDCWYNLDASENGKLRVYTKHRSYSEPHYAYWTLVINFNIQQYYKDKNILSIVYYTIDNNTPINNISYSPVKEDVC